LRRKKNENKATHEKKVEEKKREALLPISLNLCFFFSFAFLSQFGLVREKTEKVETRKQPRLCRLLFLSIWIGPRKIYETNINPEKKIYIYENFPYWNSSALHYSSLYQYFIKQKSQRSLY
jgi:hypothetical protein